jgi:hypothetical protein
MNMDECTVTIGGKKVRVTSLEFSYDFPGDYHRVSIDGVVLQKEEETNVQRKSISDSFSVGYDLGASTWTSGVVTTSTSPYEHMLKYATSSTSTCESKPKKTIKGKNMSNVIQGDLSEEFAKTQLGEDTKVLLDENVVNREGVLTEEGQAFVLNLLFNDADMKKKVVDAVKSLRESAKAEKAENK